MKHKAKREKLIKRLTRTWVTVAGAFVLSLLAVGFVLLVPFITARMTSDDTPEEVMGAGSQGAGSHAWPR